MQDPTSNSIRGGFFYIIVDKEKKKLYYTFMFDTNKSEKNKATSFMIPKDLSAIFTNFCKERGVKKNAIFISLLAEFLFLETKVQTLKKYFLKK